ncbi:MAG: hypothetical protein CM15mP126_6220 [Gammaproteobacteria bacterium]|nr:MAG: hypothetical protein CM15mP126_6220 [Gammaproteobacteria bacterium]
MPDGTSLASIETGCYDWDERVYCIGSGDINTRFLMTYMKIIPSFPF